MKRYDTPDRSAWADICRRPSADSETLAALAREIFGEVQARGDEAVRDYTLRFDGTTPPSIVVDREVLQRQTQQLEPAVKRAIDQAYLNIRAFHRAEMPRRKAATNTMPGIECWREWRPIERVGLYVPGGSAPLVSTALMLGVPAQLAGCRHIVLATPPDRTGIISPAICYAALKVGATEVMCAGGMQAIAGLAIGTASIPGVDKIFGPGNQYVTAAKQYATRYGVAIDLPAGPSEVMVVADATAIPRYVAADLLSQAEHGPDSQVMLVAVGNALVPLIERELKRQIQLLPRRDIAEKALENSRTLVLPDIATAMEFANYYAPEHLILQVANARRIAQSVVNAGSVFLGRYAPESAGDYASGTNHTLPTNGWARSASGVSVESFVKSVSFQRLTRRGLALVAPTVVALAEVEGLEAHARAVKVRLADGFDASNGPLLYNGERL